MDWVFYLVRTLTASEATFLTSTASGSGSNTIASDSAPSSQSYRNSPGAAVKLAPSFSNAAPAPPSSLSHTSPAAPPSSLSHTMPPPASSLSHISPPPAASLTHTVMVDLTVPNIYASPSSVQKITLATQEDPIVPVDAHHVIAALRGSGDSAIAGKASGQKEKVSNYCFITRSKNTSFVEKAQASKGRGEVEMRP